MVRRCAAFAFGLTLIVALAWALTHAHPLKVPITSSGFSTPCEPALPVWKAGSESPVLSTFDPVFIAAGAAAPAAAIRAFRFEAVVQPLPPAASADFPPLFRRPPPANS